MKEFIVIIVFKHLPQWRKRQKVVAKSRKKAEDIVRQMYKDSVKTIDFLTYPLLAQRYERSMD